MATVRQLVARALRTASPSLESLAESVGLSTSALRRYRLGDRTPSPAVVHRLAGALRRQAQRLTRLADMLERTTPGGGH